MMRHKIRGIVLNFIRYSESSVIVKIYTDRFGLQTYLVNQVRSEKPKHNIALFQPLTQLELVAYHNYSGKINRVNEIRLMQPYREIPFNIQKTTVVLFLAEVLSRTLKEESSHEELFEFISGSLLQYDRMEKNFQNFHLQFLFRYLKFIGLEPLGIDTLFEGDRNGRLYPLIDREVTGRLLNDQYGSDATLSRDQRRILLELLTNFILNNLEIDEPLKSLKVLKEIFE